VSTQPETDNSYVGRSVLWGLIAFGLVACAPPAQHAAAIAPVPLDTKSLPGVYQLLPMSSHPGAHPNTEALLIKKDGTFNIVFAKEEYGYYTVGKWKVEGNAIHLFPETVDEKDRAKTETDLQSGRIPSENRSKLELMLQDRVVTPIFDKGSESPKLRVESPQLEREIEPSLGNSTIYLIPQ
jgi:hypothetical protein